MSAAYPRERPLRPRQYDRIGRNEPCRCGSGLKYKRCCWEADEDNPENETTVADDHAAWIAIHEFAEPLLSKARTPDEYEGLLTIATIAWHASSILHTRAREGFIVGEIARLTEDGESAGRLRRLIDELLATMPI